MLDYFEELKKQSVTACNKDKLVDLKTIKIDAERPKIEKIIDFLCQIKNPYLFKVGDVAVRVIFDERSESFQKRFESLIETNLGN